MSRVLSRMNTIVTFNKTKCIVRTENNVTEEEELSLNTCIFKLHMPHVPFLTASSEAKAVLEVYNNPKLALAKIENNKYKKHQFIFIYLYF